MDNYCFFSYKDEIYPQILKTTKNPPKKLYYVGDLDILKNERIISIVGTRNFTSYGKNCCEKIISYLSKYGVTIVSGLALGTDAFVHELALKYNLKTIAVVGNGIDIVYPATNRKLWEEISKKGLILSEFEPGTKPFKVNFPMRNRIIAGISKATVVVESKIKGGSLITANIALEEGREVYAIPGDIFSINSEGCNFLIRDFGAKLLTDGKEIVTDLDWEEHNKAENKIKHNYSNLSQLSNKILDNLNKEKNLDEILLLVGNEYRDSILSELMELEILGHIKSVPGGKYKKIK